MQENENQSNIIQYTPATILCCICGTKIESNPSNMCSTCLQSRVDITEGIPKQMTIFWCRNCGRYQRPPWVEAPLESREMLSLCLKKLKGLNKHVKVRYLLLLFFFLIAFSLYIYIYIVRTYTHTTAYRRILHMDRTTLKTY